MRKISLIYFVAILSGIFLYSCSADDQKTQNAVVSALSSSGNSTVGATVKDGVATLTGTVQTQEQRASAEAAAKNVKDVKSVNNRIEVVAPAAPTPTVSPDQTLTNNINQRLSSEGLSGINVSVNNGEVTLTGDVKRADLQKVMEAANAANPTRVVNQLTIK